ncbi:MAG TPA: rhomboid family intramembrane serine protease [Acidobacteriota bacterium]|nr:rhomboid family intramembrane serine protease [Acidobacteriota bacterium]
MAYGPYQVTLGPRISPVVKYLIIANVVVFLWQTLASLVGSYEIIRIFGLTPYLVIARLYFWQLVTYLFLHGDLLHILFNMFALWMFGSELERYLGSSEFLKFYFITGVGAGLFSLLFHPFSTIPTIGASGAIYGILMAYGMMFPNRYVYLYFLFPVKVKYFVAVLGLIAFLSALSASQSPVDNFAHLGGMLFAFLYLKGLLSLSNIRQNYYRWKLKKMRSRFEVHEGRRNDPPRRRDDDYWIN